jgi:hypothetical protein
VIAGGCGSARTPARREFSDPITSTTWMRPNEECFESVVPNRSRAGAPLSTYDHWLTSV